MRTSIMWSSRLHNNCPVFGSYKIWRGVYLKMLISIFFVLTWKSSAIFSSYDKHNLATSPSADPYSGSLTSEQV